MKLLTHLLLLIMNTVLLNQPLQAKQTETPSSTTPSEPNKTLLLIGDSLSSDFSIEASQTWIELVNKSISTENSSWKLVNVSMPSNTLSQATRTALSLVDEYQPDAIILQLGNTDALRAAPVREIAAKTGKLITSLKSKVPNIIIFGSSLNHNFGENYVQRFLKMHLQLATEYQTGIIPDILANITDNPELLENDLTHANKQGHQQIYTNIWTTLNSYLNCVDTGGSCYYQPPQPEEKALKNGKKS